MSGFHIQKFPGSRIATLDIGTMGRKKHHVAAMIELDVTNSRIKIREFNKNNKEKISFNAWIIHVIAQTIKEHAEVASFRKGKNKRLIFNDINVSLVIEKVSDGQKVPIPLVIKKTQNAGILSISKQIEEARQKELAKDEIVLQKKTRQMEKLYYFLPAFVRRSIWIYILHHPKIAFRYMGNVAFTTVGTMGTVNGWFIPKSVHPICFGTGAIIKKPKVINDAVKIREILNMTVLLDHDVIDGGPMARFINALSKNVENAIDL